MTESNFEKRKQRNVRELERIRQKKELYDQRLEIYNTRVKMRRWKSPSTTKLVMAYILINCTIVEIYSMVAMWHLADLSALYSLIAAVVAEGFSFAIYCAKSFNETKQEELIKLERDKMELDNEPDRDDAMG